MAALLIHYNIITVTFWVKYIYILKQNMPLAKNKIGNATSVFDFKVPISYF